LIPTILLPLIHGCIVTLARKGIAYGVREAQLRHSVVRRNMDIRRWCSDINCNSQELPGATSGIRWDGLLELARTVSMERTDSN